MATSTQSVREYVATLGADAERRGVPKDLVGAASAATIRTLGHLPCGHRERARLRAYHEAVIRRRLIRSRSAARVSARMIAATVIADLRSSGRPDVSVAEELRRGWSDKLPRDVLDELSRELCA